MFEQSAVGVAVLSIGGRFLRVNPALCRLLGYTEQELLQKTHLDVIHIEDLEAAAVSRAQVISGKAKPRISRAALRAQGRLHRLGAGRRRGDPRRVRRAAMHGAHVDDISALKSADARTSGASAAWWR